MKLGCPQGYGSEVKADFENVTGNLKALQDGSAVKGAKEMKGILVDSAFAAGNTLVKVNHKIFIQSSDVSFHSLC
jgi:hypothetical protein